MATVSWVDFGDDPLLPSAFYRDLLADTRVNIYICIILKVIHIYVWNRELSETRKQLIGFVTLMKLRLNGKMTGMLAIDGKQCSLPFGNGG